MGERIGAQANPPLLIHSLNIGLMRSRDRPRINEAYLDIAKSLQTAGTKAILICANTPQGAEGIILGCTELPMLIAPGEFDLPMLATTDLHAQMAADFILGNA